MSRFTYHLIRPSEYGKFLTAVTGPCPVDSAYALNLLMNHKPVEALRRACGPLLVVLEHDENDDCYRPRKLVRTSHVARELRQFACECAIYACQTVDITHEDAEAAMRDWHSGAINESELCRTFALAADMTAKLLPKEACRTVARACRNASHHTAHQAAKSVFSTVSLLLSDNELDGLPERFAQLLHVTT